MDMSKECRMNDGPRGCWTGSQIEEGKEEDQEEPGERIYEQRWNGEICIVEIGKIENYGMQDAENGDSCKKPALYIYNYGLCIILEGTAVAQWLRCCATNRKVAGSILDGVIGIFH